jgi:hypothetical protein
MTEVMLKKLMRLTLAQKSIVKNENLDISAQVQPLLKNITNSIKRHCKI